MVLRVKGRFGVLLPQVFVFFGKRVTAIFDGTQLLRRFLSITNEPVAKVKSALLRRVSIKQFVIRLSASTLLIASSSLGWYDIEHDTESPSRVCGYIDCLSVNLCR
jgi:hypothetical protein